MAGSDHAERAGPGRARGRGSADPAGSGGSAAGHRPDYRTDRPRRTGNRRSSRWPPGRGFGQAGRAGVRAAGGRARPVPAVAPQAGRYPGRAGRRAGARLRHPDSAARTPDRPATASGRPDEGQAAAATAHRRAGGPGGDGRVTGPRGPRGAAAAALRHPGGPRAAGSAPRSRHRVRADLRGGPVLRSHASVQRRGAGSRGQGRPGGRARGGPTGRLPRRLGLRPRGRGVAAAGADRTWGRARRAQR